MYRVGVGEEGGESRETAAVAARSLRGTCRFVKRVKRKKDNARIFVFRQPVAGLSRTCVIFVGSLSREYSSGFPFSLRKKTALTLSRSCSPPSLSPLSLSPPPTSPPSPSSVPLERLSSLVPRHRRSHVSTFPINAGGPLLFREWWKVAADASSPP